MLESALVESLVASPWLYLALFGLVVGDAFLVVLPSETVVVALGAMAASTGEPNLLIVLPVAALGAVVGDSLCFSIGRAVGHDRWGWQQRGRLGEATARVRSTVLSRPAVLIFTARYIPFARIAVNLTAGAAGLSYRRFLPLTAAAGIGWALYNTAIGAFFGTLLKEYPLLAIGVSVAVAVTLGLLIDLVMRRVSAARAR